MLVKYSRGAADGTRAVIQMSADMAAKMGGHQARVSVDYDPNTRECFCTPTPNGRGVITETGFNSDWPFRLAPPIECDLPRASTVDVEAQLLGDILMFTLPAELPAPKAVHRMSKAEKMMTPEKALDLIRAALADLPAHRLLVLVPGHGLLEARPEVLRLQERSLL